MREYNVLQDPEEPTQIVDFCSSGSMLPYASAPTSSKQSYDLSTPTKSKKRTPHSASTALVRQSDSTSQRAKKRSVFADVDLDASIAVSFCFGEGDGDWSVFALYCLMQNGDLYCVCPYLPKTAQVPSRPILNLAAFVSAKLEYLSINSENRGPSEKQALESRYSQQMKFVNSILSQRSSVITSAAEDDTVLDEDDYIKVRYPTYLRYSLARQGPFLLQPAPRELDGSEESLAYDIAYVHLDHGESGTGELGFIFLGYSDGKVDLCLDVEKVEAQWDALNDVTVRE